MKEGYGVQTVPKLLAEMTPPNRKGTRELGSHHLIKDTNISSYDQILQQGMTERLLDELSMTAVRVNYGQTPREVHAFVGTVGSEEIV